MSDETPTPEATPTESAAGFFQRWLSQLKPDPTSSDPRKLGKWGGIVLGAYLAIALVVGMYWSRTPDHFDVRENATRYAAATNQDVVTGTTTVAALQEVIRTLLEKPGGYLHNDLFPPGVWLDNMPNWEYGLLVQSRDLARALREVLSRSQSQSKTSSCAHLWPLNFWVWGHTLVDDKFPLGMLGRFLDSIKDAISFAQFFGDKRNVKGIRGGLKALRKTFAEMLDTAIELRKVINKIYNFIKGHLVVLAQDEVLTPFEYYNQKVFDRLQVAYQQKLCVVGLEEYLLYLEFFV